MPITTDITHSSFATRYLVNSMDEDDALLPDEFFDALDKFFGTDDGYKNHLCRIYGMKDNIASLQASEAKLEAENERILDRGSQVASDLFIENEKLKEFRKNQGIDQELLGSLEAENYTLKAENERLKEKVKGFTELHNLVVNMANDDNAHLQEENEELEEENAKLKGELEDDKGQIQQLLAAALRCETAGAAAAAENEKLKAENERLTKKSDSSDEYIDILQGRCYRINNQYCRWKHQKKRLPWDRMISMEEIDERLKMDDNIDLTLAPLFKIMKHFMEENEQLKAENEQLKAD